MQTEALRKLYRCVAEDLCCWRCRGSMAEHSTICRPCR